MNYYIMVRGSSHQDDIVILNVYVLNNRTLKYMKLKLIELKGGKTIPQLYCRTSIPLFQWLTEILDPHPPKKTISKDIENLNDTSNRIGQAFMETPSNVCRTNILFKHHTEHSRRQAISWVIKNKQTKKPWTNLNSEAKWETN